MVDVEPKLSLLPLALSEKGFGAIAPSARPEKERERKNSPASCPKSREPDLVANVGIPIRGLESAHRTSRYPLTSRRSSDPGRGVASRLRAEGTLTTVRSLPVSVKDEESQRGSEPFLPKEFDTGGASREMKGRRSAHARPLDRTAPPQLRNVAPQTREPRRIAAPGLRSILLPRSQGAACVCSPNVTHRELPGQRPQAVPFPVWSGGSSLPRLLQVGGLHTAAPAAQRRIASPYGPRVTRNAGSLQPSGESFVPSLCSKRRTNLPLGLRDTRRRTPPPGTKGSPRLEVRSGPNEASLRADGSMRRDRNKAIRIDLLGRLSKHQ